MLRHLSLIHISKRQQHRDAPGAFGHWRQLQAGWRKALPWPCALGDFSKTHRPGGGIFAAGRLAGVYGGAAGGAAHYVCLANGHGLVYHGCEYGKRCRPLFQHHRLYDALFRRDGHRLDFPFAELVAHLGGARPHTP